MGEWICLKIDIVFVKGNKVNTIIYDEVCKIFKDDLKDVIIIGNHLSDDCFEVTSENYMFIKCNNYFNYINQLKESKVIIGVLESYNNPIYVPDEEIKQFKLAINQTNSMVKLGKGSEVKVKEGYLQNLVGIVTKVLSKNNYEVTFKLYTKLFTETLSRRNLVYQKSIFDVIRSPVINKKLVKRLAKRIKGEL